MYLNMRHARKHLTYLKTLTSFSIRNLKLRLCFQAFTCFIEILHFDLVADAQNTALRVSLFIVLLFLQVWEDVKYLFKKGGQLGVAL